MKDRTIFLQWVRATWIGWVLGIPAIIVLALIGEGVGIGGSQVLVGAGMGAGLGFMQGRVMRALLQKFAPWFWSCAVGLAVPFLAWDIANAAKLNVTYSLFVCVASGGLIVGVWQAFLLRTRFPRAGWWVLANAVGWLAAAGLAKIAETLPRSQSLRGIGGALAYLGIVTGGGLILGLVTGVPMVWLRRQDGAAQ